MKILFFTLSNIGDCLLTLPALDALRQNIPDAKITVICGARAKDIFQDNPYIENAIVYNKRVPFRDQLNLFRHLFSERFDVVVDLRNTFLSVLLTARYKTSPFLSIPKCIRHTKDRHLFKVNALLTKMKVNRPAFKQETTLFIHSQDKIYIKNILEQDNINFAYKVIIVSAGARSHIKRWPKERFCELLNALAQDYRVKIILVGDKDEVQTSRYIAENCGQPVLDLTGKTTLLQLAPLLPAANVVITNDSATLHLASYLNLPIVAIFGPTNEAKYGPWSDNYRIVNKEIFCRPCEKAQCKFVTLGCMSLIKVEDVLTATRSILSTSYQLPATSYSNFKRILIVRTDRIGDVLLSTPVIKALRDAYPHAYIAMMVSPYAKDIVDGNPYLDHVITYDKDGKHKSWRRTFKFARNLRKNKFDLSLVLHPTNRVHIVTFIAGIPRRIGYNRKLGFLLTDQIKHTKHLGEKHESEYALDLVRYLGIEPKDKDLFMPIKPESENWAEDLFRQEGIKESDKLLVIHPVASCISRVWPSERFAGVADKLIEKYGFKVFIIAGSDPQHIKICNRVVAGMHHPAINLAGRTSVSQLASLLKRCRLHISTDTGPMHIASAVGAPVVAIFGRSQKGLSPKRWGPLGGKDKYLHKQVGCIQCLAHNCKKEFLCLKAISVEDVVNAADSILK